MPSKSKIEEVRASMVQSGLWITGDEIWPYDDFHLITIASTDANIDLDWFANHIAEYTGVFCIPLPKKSSTPNVYTFLAYRATPTATVMTPTGPVVAHVYVSDVEQALAGAGVILVGVYVKPLKLTTGVAEEVADAAKAFVVPIDGDEIPTLLADNEPVTPHMWYWLRVSPVGGGPPADTGAVKAWLENKGFKVIAPDKGISGFFEDRETYITPDGTYVLFNSAANVNVTANGLYSDVLSKFGDFQPTFFTTPEIINGQASLDTFYSFQGVEDGVGNVGQEALQAIEALLKILQKLLSALPTIVWLGIGGAAVFAGWNIYKYIREERERPSVLRRKERAAYADRR